MSSNTTDKSRIEELRTKIEQRKACEKRALDISLTLIETDKVTTETLITSVTAKSRKYFFSYPFSFLIGESDRPRTISRC